MSELRVKQTKTSGNEKELETSPRNQRKAALVSPETQGKFLLSKSSLLKSYAANPGEVNHIFKEFS